MGQNFGLRGRRLEVEEHGEDVDEDLAGTGVTEGIAVDTGRCSIVQRVSLV